MSNGYELEIIKVLKKETEYTAATQNVYGKVIALKNYTIESMSDQDLKKIKDDIRFSRKNLADAGIIDRNSPKGIWKLSEEGKDFDFNSTNALAEIDRLVKINNAIDLLKKEGIDLEKYEDKEVIKKKDVGKKIGLESYNMIVFGAPGTGKSYYLNKKIISFYKVERVTFYPSYSYSQFVGCYKPIMNGKDISYSFVPGPFLRTYVEAVKDTSNNYLLIIEEINRADAASVFGDVFQLLDRDEDGKSVYDISTSEDVKSYLEKEKVSDPNKICIPSNMYIWATMNSADQGVFPMDTAFKRRWNFLYFDLNGNPIEDDESCPVKKGNWEDIRKAINNWLCEKKVNEDKHLGKFFINDGDNVEEKDFRDTFKNKVLMYLYEDAARAFRSELFVKNNFSEILNDFNERGTDIFRPDSIKSIANKVDNAEERAAE